MESHDSPDTKTDLKPPTLWAAFLICVQHAKQTDTPTTFPPQGDLAMLMIYDYRVTVLHFDSPLQTDVFEHAIVADTTDDRVKVLRQSLECVDGCTVECATLLSARALTVHEMSLLDRSALMVHPIPGSSPDAADLTTSS